jgi:DNA-directed RNA polymerase subunit F
MGSHYEIKSSEFIPIATVRKVLRKRNKTDLTYEQKMALENTEEFTRLNERPSKNIVKELKKLEMRKLKDKFIVKIADMAPNTKEELDLIIRPSKVSFKDDEIKKILEIVKKNAK